jgi:hypothetical protein
MENCIFDPPETRDGILVLFKIALSKTAASWPLADSNPRAGEDIFASPIFKRY